MEISADLRGAAILDSEGQVLAATGHYEAWQSAANGFVEAADKGAGQSMSQVHVGTEEGEVFAVRQGGFTVVAAAERFTLAGLMLFDIRSVLRELAHVDQAPDAAGAPAKAEAA